MQPIERKRPSELQEAHLEEARKDSLPLPEFPLIEQQGPFFIPRNTTLNPPIQKLPFSTGEAIIFSEQLPNGDIVAVGSNSVHICRSGNFQWHSINTWHDRIVHAELINEQLLITVPDNGNLKLWNLTECVCAGEIADCGNPIITPSSGNSFYLSCLTGEVYLYEGNQNVKSWDIGRAIWSSTLIKDGILYIKDRENICRFDLANNRELESFPSSVLPGCRMVILEGNRLLTIDKEWMRITNLDTGKVEREELNYSPWEILYTKRLPGNRLLIERRNLGNENDSLEYWDLSLLVRIAKWKQSPFRIENSVCMGNLLFTLDAKEKKVRMWDLETLTNPCSFTIPGSPVLHMQGLNDKRVILFCRDGSCHLLDGSLAAYTGSFKRNTRDQNQTLLSLENDLKIEPPAILQLPPETLHRILAHLPSFGDLNSFNKTCRAARVLLNDPFCKRSLIKVFYELCYKPRLANPRQYAIGGLQGISNSCVRGAGIDRRINAGRFQFQGRKAGYKISNCFSLNPSKIAYICEGDCVLDVFHRHLIGARSADFNSDPYEFSIPLPTFRIMPLVSQDSRWYLLEKVHRLLKFTQENYCRPTFNHLSPDLITCIESLGKDHIAMATSTGEVAIYPDGNDSLNCIKSFQSQSKSCVQKMLPLPNGKMAIATESGLEFWDIESDVKHLSSYPITSIQQLKNWGTNQILVVKSNGDAIVFNSNTCEILSSKNIHLPSQVSILPLKSGALATGSDVEDTIKIWSLEMELIYSIKHPFRAITSIAQFGNGVIAATFYDGTLAAWDYCDQKLLWHYKWSKNPENGIYSCFVDPEEQAKLIWWKVGDPQYGILDFTS